MGNITATTITLPAASRLWEERSSWPDVLLTAARAVLLVFWTVRPVPLERTLRGPHREGPAFMSRALSEGRSTG